MIRELAYSNETSFLPLWEAFQSASKVSGLSAITTDGIHLTSAGHELLAKRWLDFYSTL